MIYFKFNNVIKKNNIADFDFNPGTYIYIVKGNNENNLIEKLIVNSYENKDGLHYFHYYNSNNIIETYMLYMADDVVILNDMVECEKALAMVSFTTLAPSDFEIILECNDSMRERITEIKENTGSELVLGYINKFFKAVSDDTKYLIFNCMGKTFNMELDDVISFLYLNEVFIDHVEDNILYEPILDEHNLEAETEIVSDWIEMDVENVGNEENELLEYVNANGKADIYKAFDIESKQRKFSDNTHEQYLVSLNILLEDKEN